MHAPRSIQYIYEKVKTNLSIYNRIVYFCQLNEHMVLKTKENLDHIYGQIVKIYIFFFIAQRFVKHFHTCTRYIYQLRKRKPSYLSFTLNALLIVSFSYCQKPSHSCKYKSFCPSYKLVKFWCPSIYKVILVSFLSNPFFVLCIIHSCMFSIQLDFILSSRAIHSFQPWPSPSLSPTFLINTVYSPLVSIIPPSSSFQLLYTLYS